MSKTSKKRQRMMSEIETRRHDVEHALGVLRLGTKRELAFLPKGRRWMLPTVAFAIGAALAGGGSKPARSAPPRDTDED